MIDPNIVIELFNQGHGSGAIAKKLNCGRKVIRNVFKKYDLKRDAGSNGFSQRDNIASRKKYFWNNMRYSESTGCREWMGRVDSDGYGVLIFNKVKQKAHRLAFILTHGEIPDGLLVCHKCDNRICCNLDHLFLGTNKDNTIDCLMKNRHGNQKLKAEDIKVIRRMVEEGHALSMVAKQFNVHRTTIKGIADGKTWTFIC